MEPRISFITLAVADLAAARHFYCDGLGWPAVFDDGDEVVMIRTGGHLVLSLWDRAAFAAEVGEPLAPSAGIAPFTLAHNVATREEVDTVLAVASRAGASVGEPAERVWGGYTGYFADPDGHRWEIAWNPAPVGQIVLPSPAQ